MMFNNKNLSKSNFIGLLCMLLGSSISCGESSLPTVQSQSSSSASENTHELPSQQNQIQVEGAREMVDVLARICNQVALHQQSVNPDNHPDPITTIPTTPNDELDERIRRGVQLLEIADRLGGTCNQQ